MAPRAVPDVSQAPKVQPRVSLTGEITYQGFYDFIPDYIDANTILGSDASMNYFGSLLLIVTAAKGFFVQSLYSAMGYIGPAATGICLAKKDGQRVMVFSGDGGFQMSAQCLSTQTRFKLNPIIFVIDNGVYGVEQWLADASVFDNKNKKPFYKSCVLHQWGIASWQMSSAVVDGRSAPMLPCRLQSRRPWRM
jgi:indolepyruvate decarboxylase